MGDLNKVIDFCACADSGFAEFCPVNAAISTYFDKILDNDYAVMWYEAMGAVDKIIAETG
jgi:hypothetical protein